MNITETMTHEVIDSYKAVGNYLGKMEEELDIKIFPQGSLALGTVVRPIKNDVEGEYDVDLVCELMNGTSLSSREIKNIVGDRLMESERYSKMLEDEGKRCWTLKYSTFHMDILPCVPLDKESIANRIRLTHKEDSGAYMEKYSNPKGYREWFIEEMATIYDNSREIYAQKRNVEIEEVQLFQLRTPLQKAIQILKRHRDIMFTGKNNKPISIIITTLATKAYDGENNLFDAIENILFNMDKYIEYDSLGNAVILNPTIETENFADKWSEDPTKKDAFISWLKKARQDIIENPLEFVEGMDVMKKNMRGIFGERVVDETFERYNLNISLEKEKGLLGVTGSGNISNTRNPSTVSSIKEHTFYGK